MREQAKDRDGLLLLLLCALALLVLAVSADRALQGGVFRPALDRQLRRASASVAAIGQRERKRTRDIRMPGGTMAGVKLGPQYKPRQALAALSELEKARRECRSVVAHLKARSTLPNGAENGRQTMKQLGHKRSEAEKRLGEFLILEPGRARIVLCALGWPWLSEESLEEQPVDGLPPPYPGLPPALRKIRPARLSTILEEASRPEEAWLTATGRLRRRHGLSSEQTRALQCWLCRSALRRAFQSPPDRQQAATALQRHAALAPAQVTAVLGMRGAQALLGAGPASFPPLIDMLHRRQDVALPLLHQAAGRWGLHRQAFRAARRLIETGSPGAEEELLALGPFGLDALRELARAGHTGREAQRVFRRLQSRWPRGEDALEILGSDPRLWRRWHARAREVL